MVLKPQLNEGCGVDGGDGQLHVNGTRFHDQQLCFGWLCLGVVLLRRQAKKRAWMQ